MNILITINKLFYMSLNRNKSIVYILFIFLSLAGCKTNIYYNKVYSFKNEIWKLEDIKSFNVNIDDTNSLYDIFINLRNTGAYPYQNIFLFITIYAPINYYYTDTLEILLADEMGKWYGKGIGNNFYQKAPFKKNVKFPYRGIYRFDIQHGMRFDELKGISDLGLTIEKKIISQKK